jgi:hypothetical protein
MSANIQQIVESQIRLTNTSADSMQFWLEPWGQLYNLAPASSVDVYFESDRAGVPEVIHEQDRIVVYGWPGATARVLSKGEEVEQVDQRPLS